MDCVISSSTDESNSEKTAFLPYVDVNVLRYARARYFSGLSRSSPVCLVRLRAT
jgi:hypothetical protein